MKIRSFEIDLLNDCTISSSSTLGDIWDYLFAIWSNDNILKVEIFCEREGLSTCNGFQCGRVKNSLDDMGQTPKIVASSIPTYCRCWSSPTGQNSDIHMNLAVPHRRHLGISLNCMRYWSTPGVVLLDHNVDLEVIYKPGNKTVSHLRTLKDCLVDGLEASMPDGPGNRQKNKLVTREHFH